MKLKYIIGLILAVLVIIVFIQNTQVVNYRVFFWRISVSQIILVPLTLLIGFAFGYLIAKIRKKRSTSS